MNESRKKVFHVHLVSDATGDTINSISRACLAQFTDVRLQIHYWNMIRTKRQLDLVAEGLRHWPGLVLYTFVDEKMERALEDICLRNNLPSHSVLDPILTVMGAFLGRQSEHAPGKQHVLDDDYFARIEAMEYALSFDDGNRMDKLECADVVVIGVSRTSKTPTCIYLSHRGIKAANVPIVPNVPLSLDFETLTKPLVVALTRDPDALVETRRNRLRLLNQADDTDYTDPEQVRDEVREARRLYAKLGCPVIDVTRRSVEETSAEIMMLLHKRKLEKEIQKATEEGKECPL